MSAFQCLYHTALVKAFLSVRLLTVGVSRPGHGFHTSDSDSVEGLNGRGGDDTHLPAPTVCFISSAVTHAYSGAMPCDRNRAIEFNGCLYGAVLGPETGQPSGQASHRNHASWLTRCSQGNTGQCHANPRTNWCPSHLSQLHRPRKRVSHFPFPHYFVSFFLSSGCLEILCWSFLPLILIFNTGKKLENILKGYFTVGKFFEFFFQFSQFPVKKKKWCILHLVVTH